MLVLDMSGLRERGHFGSTIAEKLRAMRAMKRTRHI
jgi:hypothetical protein